MGYNTSLATFRILFHDYLGLGNENGQMAPELHTACFLKNQKIIKVSKTVKILEVDNDEIYLRPKNSHNLVYVRLRKE
jgi:hypothetical protein